MLNEQNCVPAEHIDNLFKQCDFQVTTVFGNCTIVACRMPNGYVLVESSGSIDPTNYSEELGTQFCLDRIKNRIWRLEGYVGANEFSIKQKA